MSETRGRHSINIDGNPASSWRKTIEQLNFQERKCSTFIAQEMNEQCCICNNPNHPKDTPKSKGIWTWKNSTERKTTTCYDLHPDLKRPYLRCDIETEMEQLCLVLLGVWHIPMPSLIMRMIGDAVSTMHIKLEKELLHGISEAALASDAWIFTSGYKEEAIAELIGEIVYKQQVQNANLNFSAIAVGKWGNIRDCRKLEKDVLEATKNHRPSRYTLEPNHTHYIFFDDGTYDSIDTGGFVSKLARHISRKSGCKIPLVSILVGGNLYALKSIWNDLLNGVSVVVVDQSGSLANLICKYLKATKNIREPSTAEERADVGHEESNNIDENDIDIFMLEHSFATTTNPEQSNSSTRLTLAEALRPLGKWRLEIYKDLLKLYSVIRQEEYKFAGKKLNVDQLLNLEEKRTLAKYIFRFATCLTKLRDKIHIFDFNPSKSLHNTIYDAWIQAGKNLFIKSNTNDKTVHDQISTALRWSIPNISGDQLLASTIDWNDSKQIKPNRDKLLDALSKNLHIFVRNFLQLDIDLSVLLVPPTDKVDSAWGIEAQGTWARENDYLKELYSDSKRINSDPLYLLPKISSKTNFKNENDLNKILSKLVGDSMKPFYDNQAKVGPSQVVPVEEDEIQKKNVEEIYRDIFLWCVLTFRLPMARVILGQMKTRICSVLIASKILKSFIPYAPDHESRERLQSEADLFELYAIEFVRCSYSYNKQYACELIMRKVNLYGGVTCLQMAMVADSKKFLYEGACQALLTNIWYDKVDPVQERARLTVNIFTLGISQIFISAYEKRSVSTVSNEEETDTTPLLKQDRLLEKHGINYTDDYTMNKSTWRHFIHFHNRPITKFFYTCFGYALFLLFFSYYMLYAFEPRSDLTPSIHWTEILTIIIVSTMLFEEVRQFFFQDNRSLKGKFLAYFDLHNRLSSLCLVLPSYLLFYVGLILRFVLTDLTDFSAARIMMAYDLELWYIRAVLFVGIAPDLGPKLVMIRKMTTDLLLFIIIIVIFIFAYGITSRSMIAYGTFGFDGREFFYNVVYPVYYFVLGSFDDELTKLNDNLDGSTNIATHVMFAFHMLFVNILLLNLLIALFSNTVTDVHTQAKYIWAYDRCTLVREYYARPALFPPFTFLVSLFDFVRWCWRRCTGKDSQKFSCFKMIPVDPDLDKEWSEFERFSTNDYIRQLLDAQINTATSATMEDITSELSPTSTDESKWLKSEINQIKDELGHTRRDVTDRLFFVDMAVSHLRYRVDEIDAHMSKMASFEKSLDWIMGAMERVRMDKEPPYIGQKPGESAPSSQRPNPSEQPTQPEKQSKVFIQPVLRTRGASTTDDNRFRTRTTTNDHTNT